MAKIGALSMVFGAHLLVPHGGIFVLLITNAVTQLLLYVFAIAVGTVVTAGILFIVKKPVAEIIGQLADTQIAAV
jgi:PTS system fructose-specific IIC component